MAPLFAGLVELEQRSGSLDGYIRAKAQMWSVLMWWTPEAVSMIRACCWLRSC